MRAPLANAADTAGRAAFGRNEQRFVIGIHDDGEDGITASAVQAIAFEATRVETRLAVSTEHQRVGAPRAAYGAKPPNMAGGPRSLVHGKLPITSSRAE